MILLLHRDRNIARRRITHVNVEGQCPALRTANSLKALGVLHAVENVLAIVKDSVSILDLDPTSGFKRSDLLLDENGARSSENVLAGCVSLARPNHSCLHHSRLSA